MPGVDNGETRAKMIRKIFIPLFFFLLLAGYFTFVPASPSRADRYSPPDESIPESPSGDEARAEAERKKEEAARREQQRKAEASRQAREKAKRDAKKAEEEAAEAKRREAEEMAKAASEDMINGTLAIGRTLVENGRFQSALNVLSGFLDGNPHSADGWYLISLAHHALGDYDRAQIASNIALEIDPYYPELAKTPNGLEPRPYLTKQQRREPSPSMSVLPVIPPLPANLRLEPVVISFPMLAEAERPQEKSADTTNGARLKYTPHPPEPRGSTAAWMRSERWGEISRWRFRVDRMGILTEPRVPVAWKGSHPYEVYFWTGDEWARVRRTSSKSGKKESYGDILRGAREGITEVLNDRGFVWNEADTPSLAASASLMRYMWMGSVDLTRERDMRAVSSNDAE
jgi:tetratricopeptide (TPR) repeat protein